MSKRRHRSASMIKIENRRMESQMRFEQGNCHVKAGNLEKALFSYNKALDLNPSEKSALVARSQCYILLGQPQKAFEDAETALSIDKTFIKAIYQKAEALYYLGDFEHSLMYHHRGLRLRPEHEGFKLGVHKAQKAIENAIGSPFPATADRTKVGTPSSAKNSDVKTSGTNRTATPKPKSAKKSRLLRELGADKDYLDKLMNNPDLKCKSKENDDDLKKYIQDAVDILNTRQEFWRQQLPPTRK